ncbi:MAG TPA: hypothetical protein VN181_08845 [Thermoanaerobaculia bacterium]|nr:hypothetical protein [Thermoanaerobaculia bacterium]
MATKPIPAISGSYRGPLTSGGTQRLDLRIDVDARIDDGAVLRRVSGDIFRVDKVAMPGKPPKETEVYQESWILEQPQVKATSDAVTITGAIRYWNAIHPKTTASIRVPLQPAGAAAQVTLQRQASPPMAFVCAPAGRFFRSLNLEVDVCKSVSAEPTLPKYATHSLKQRPPGLSNRELTLERVYGEAGVELVVRSEGRTIIDDTVPGFAAWTDTELHNAMEHHFTQYKGAWPKWEMWGLVAGAYHDDLVGGVMFDYAGAEGSAHKAPERQGFAVFRKHFWFDSLVANPKTEAQFEAARRFLWLFTHESGHAFNLLHSFDKNRENALSWMNYVESYDALHKEGAFWSGFRFSFDDEELLHIRHGNRSSVIMGGDPFSSGGHAEAPPGAEHLRMPPGAMTSISGEAPLEILVRSEQYFQFLEPVSVEIRARNLLPIPLSVSATLHPEHGSVTIYIRRPDGRIVEYMPISCKLAPDRTVTLGAAGAHDSTDRHSRTVFVSYGRYGFYFDEPGQYSIRAVYHGPGNLLIPSNVQRVRVGHPKTEEADRLAQDFFSYESGVSLYLGGSHSQFLTGGMNTLLDVVDRHAKTLAGAKIAARVARGIGMPFHDFGYDDDAVSPKTMDAEPQLSLRRSTSGDPEEALRLIDIAMKTFDRHPSARLSIPIERAVRTRAYMLVRMGKPEEARDELIDLAGDLDKAGVKAGVVQQIQRDAERIAPAPKSRPPARRRKK